MVDWDQQEIQLELLVGENIPGVAYELVTQMPHAHSCVCLWLFARQNLQAISELCHGLCFLSFRYWPQDLGSYQPARLLQGSGAVLSANVSNQQVTRSEVSRAS